MFNKVKKKIVEWLNTQHPVSSKSITPLTDEEQYLLVLLKENVFDMDIKESSIFVPTYQWNIYTHPCRTSEYSVYTLSGVHGTYLQNVYISLEMPSDYSLDKVHKIRDVSQIRKVYCDLLKDEHQHLALQAVREALSEYLSKIARNRDRDRKTILRHLYSGYTGKQYTYNECVLDMLTIKEERD